MSMYQGELREPDVDEEKTKEKKNVKKRNSLYSNVELKLPKFSSRNSKIIY